MSLGFSTTNAPQRVRSGESGHHLANGEVVCDPPHGIVPDGVTIQTVVGGRSSDDGLTRRISGELACKVFGPGLRRVVFAQQVHGGTVRRAHAGGQMPSVGPEVVSAGRCDGLWTSDPGVCLVIRTADCTPVAVWDKGGHRLALVHSGWRGTLENVLGEAIAQFLGDGAQARDLSIWLGPAISVSRFEVGTEVPEAFSRRWPDWHPCWQGNRLDLEGILVRQACQAGVPEQQIHRSGLCTFSAPRQLPSHRREGVARVHSLYTLALLRVADRPE